MFGSVAISPLLLFAFEEGGGLEGAEDAGGQGSIPGIARAVGPNAFARG